MSTQLPPSLQQADHNVPPRVRLETHPAVTHAVVVKDLSQGGQLLSVSCQVLSVICQLSGVICQLSAGCTDQQVSPGPVVSPGVGPLAPSDGLQLARAQGRAVSVAGVGGGSLLPSSSSSSSSLSS